MFLVFLPLFWQCFKKFFKKKSGQKWVTDNPRFYLMVSDFGLQERTVFRKMILVTQKYMILQYLEAVSVASFESSNSNILHN